MNIPLSKVEEEMLKMLRLKDKRYRRGLLQKIQEELKEDYDRLKKWKQNNKEPIIYKSGSIAATSRRIMSILVNSKYRDDCLSKSLEFLNTTCIKVGDALEV